MHKVQVGVMRLGRMQVCMQELAYQTWRYAPDMAVCPRHGGMPQTWHAVPCEMLPEAKAKANPKPKPNPHLMYGLDTLQPVAKMNASPPPSPPSPWSIPCRPPLMPAGCPGDGPSTEEAAVLECRGLRARGQGGAASGRQGRLGPEGSIGGRCTVKQANLGLNRDHASGGAVARGGCTTRAAAQLRGRI